MGSSVSEQPKRKAAQAPISAHPAFPMIVALWFAALLGLGSLVLPVAMYERASAASGLSSLVDAAQPPLGVTARILVALVAGGLGVFAGLAIARRVVAASLPGPAPRRFAAGRGAAKPLDSAAKRPISAHEELGEGGLDADAGEAPRRDLLPGRRRALSVTDDSPRSEFLDHAPLPGTSSHHEPLPEADGEPLDLAGFDSMAAVEEDLAADAAAPGLAPFGSAMLSHPPVPGAAFAAPAKRTDALRGEQPPAAIANEADMTLAPPPAPDAGLEKPLGAMAMVDLVERFARALQQHRESAQRASESVDGVDAVVDLTSALSSRETPAAGTAAGPPSAIPAALRPPGCDALDDDDDDVPALALSLAARRSANPAEAACVDESDDEPARSDEHYSSLLAMKSPFGLPREAVRIDDEDERETAAIEPVVIFPGQPPRRAAPAADATVRTAVSFSTPPLRPFDAPADRLSPAAPAVPVPRPTPPADSAETERRLREAFEKLQKMSGVG